MNYFTSNDALHIQYNSDANPESNTDHFGIGEQVQSLNPVGGNELELGQRRRKREAVQVVMAESVQNYDASLNLNDLYNIKNNFTDSQRTDENVTEESSTQHSSSSSSSTPSITTTAEVLGSVEWSVPLENNNNPSAEIHQNGNQDWTPQNHQYHRPMPQALPQPPRTILYPSNYDYQSIKRKIDNHKRNPQKKNSYPHFHVTYWLFYPYSQGKTMCSISLGPLGRVPIPLIFGVCLGTRKDFGSHIGDWEHMSLSFRGRAEPDVS